LLPLTPAVAIDGAFTPLMMLMLRERDAASIDAAR